MSGDSRDDTWSASRQALRAVLERHGRHGTAPDADFLIAEENQGGDMHFVYVFKIRPLSSRLVADVMRLLERDYPGRSVLFGLAMSTPDDGPVQPDGLVVHAGLVDELWDRDALAARFGPEFTWPDGADALPVYRHLPDDAQMDDTGAGGPARSGVAACYRALDEAGKQIALLAEPCRTAVMVDSAWGIIGNGGFAYFFEMNFDGEPEYTVFTDAFRRVGLDEIASRFADLVDMFPFSEPHTAPERRIAFMEAEPPDFMAAMAALEQLVYSRDDIDQVLDAFLQASHGGVPMPDAG